MLLKAIQARLENSEFLVKGAVEFSELDKKPVSKTTAFVIPLGYTVAEEQRDTGPDLVRQNDSIGIVLVVRNLSDSRGNHARESQEAYSKTIRDQLFGWVPGSGYAPLMIGNGRLLKFKDHTIYWLDEFKTSHLEQALQ